MFNAQIQYYDPYVNSIKINDKLLKSIKNLTSKRIQSFDITLLLTDHDEVNYKEISSITQQRLLIQETFINLIKRSSKLRFEDYFFT